MDLFARRRELLKMGGGLLPPGYRQLSYITGNGAYIDTGLTTSLPFTYECEVRWESFGTRQLFGANGGSFFGVKDDGMWQCGHAGTQSTGVQASTGQWYNVRFYKEDREQSTKPTYLEVDGVQIGSTTPTYTANEICVFSSTRGANIATNASVKWYKVWIGNTLVRHFIPCVDPNNVVGMYDIINHQFYGSANSANFIGYGDEIYSLTNYVCNGTVSTVVNSGLRLFDDSIPNWQLDLDVTWATSTPTHQQTIVDAKMDANPYQGVIIRWDNTSPHLGNECGFGTSASTSTTGGNTTLYNTVYGKYARVDGSTHFTMTIRKIGVNFYFIYNGTDWWEGTITNYTHSKYLYIGANNNNNIGTAFRRFFTGTINSLKITQLW